MTDPDALSGEMPRNPWASALGQEADEPMLDMLLDGQPLPADSPAGMFVLAERLAELAGPAGTGQLPGQAAALAAFSRALRQPHAGSAGATSPGAASAATPSAAAPSAATPSAATPSAASPLKISPGGSPTSGSPITSRVGGRHRRKILVPRTRLAAAITVVVLGTGGTAAAYAGALPAPVQDFAHRMIGAPTAGLTSVHQHGNARPHVTPAGTARGHKLPPAGHGKAKGHAAKKHAQKGHAAKKRAPKRKRSHSKPAKNPHPTKSASRGAISGS